MQIADSKLKELALDLSNITDTQLVIKINKQIADARASFI